MPGEPDKHAVTTPLPTGTAEPKVGAGAQRPRPFLLIYQKDRVETVRLAPGRDVVIGRESPADVQIADSSLSRRHARFSLEGEGVRVEDLGSTNGTRMGGKRISRELLQAGQAVTLGAVTIGVHALPAPHAFFLDMGDHDALRSAIEAEIERSRFFRRPFAVVTVRSREARVGHVGRWSPRVRGLLRPVDRIGLYSQDTIEILLPETGQEQAVSFAAKIVAGAEGEPALGAGVAVFPLAGGSADSLIEQSRKAALLADAGASVRVAPAGGARAWTPEPEESGSPIIAKSAGLRAVVELSRRAARAVVPVLLTGETGTGKEVLARLIHESGPRRERPMICVNCGALPSQLVESTLFGHERGAFTGAIQTQKGVFESAEGGTVFLDEVGELPAPAQAALLRVLEAKRIMRVGSPRELEVDVRIVAATHRDLEAMVSAGAFREDLYYRLCVMTLEIPPLRERVEDIPLLAARFVQVAAEANGSAVRSIDAEAIAVLERCPWPGNVRELRNVIERAVVIAEGEVITPNELSGRLRALAGAGAGGAPEPAKEALAAEDPVAGEAEGGGLREQMDRFEAKLLWDALRRGNGSQAEAARLLQVPLRTLQHRLKAHGIRRGGYEGPNSKG
ncbi:MAG: sigma 54-interacting transcriptional regulator [Polyangiaceae bacterium]